MLRKVVVGLGDAVPWILTTLIDDVNQVERDGRDYDVTSAMAKLTAAELAVKPYVKGNPGGPWYADYEGHTTEDMVVHSAAFRSHCKPSVFKPLMFDLDEAITQATTTTQLYSEHAHDHQLAEARKMHDRCRVTQCESALVSSVKLYCEQPMKLKRSFRAVKLTLKDAEWQIVYGPIRADAKINISVSRSQA